MRLINFESHSLRLILHFTRHVFVGTFLFLIVGLGAIILKLFNDGLIILNMPPIIIKSTHYLEIFIFAVDMLGFLVFIVAETYELCSEIIFEKFRKKGEINE